MYSNGHLGEFRRLALHRTQIDALDLLPNPAKLTDSRSAVYVEQHGYDSWELDALEPDYVIDLITQAVGEYRDDALWQETINAEEAEKEVLRDLINDWDGVKDYLGH